MPVPTLYQDEGEGDHLGGWKGEEERMKRGRRPEASTHMLAIPHVHVHASVPTFVYPKRRSQGPAHAQQPPPFSTLRPEGLPENPPRQGDLKRLRNCRIICFGLK